VKTRVEIYTDGACSGNPGPGGWGAILRYRVAEREMSGWSPRTTNNRMELLAAIRALEALNRPCEVAITTDSQYVKQGMTTWIASWKRKGWLTASREPVKNKDLWKRLDALCAYQEVTWHWIRGHTGHPENERADRLARSAIALGLDGEIPPDPEGGIPD